MGMRAAQIHKAGALELRPAIRIQRPKPTMKAEIAAFSMFDPTTKPIDRPYRFATGLKRSGLRGRSPREG